MWIRRIPTHGIKLRFLYLCSVFPQGVDNKVINGGEKVNFTARLKPSPPNPSSFYASREPALHWPIPLQSHSFSSDSPLSLWSPLRRMHTNSHTHQCARMMSSGREKKITSAFNSPTHPNPFWEAGTYSGQKKKKMRQTRVKNVMHNRRHAEWLLRYPVSFKWRYHSQKKGSLVCVPMLAYQTATWISLIWRTK